MSSEPGVGTSFRIFFRRADEAAAAPLGLGAQVEVAPGNETVLVVEDEEPLRLLVRDVLEVNGYNVLEAQHGGVALEVLAEKGDAINLLLTDVAMPQVNGIELVEKVMRQNLKIKILLMSGCAQDEAVPDTIARMGLPFLPKPFTPDVLAAKVRYVLDTEEPQGEAEKANL